jgi:plasmid segregation protein ParM
MTNTIFIPLVAIDDGSGNIAYSFTDKDGALIEGHQPSIIEKGVKMGVAGISDSAWACESGERYTVRNASSDPEATCYREYQISEANRVLVHDTLSTAGLGGVECIIGCTIPTTQYYNKGDAVAPINTDLVNKKKASILSPVTNINGAKTAAKIKNILVFPEAIPAYVYVALNSDGSIKEEYANDIKTLIVDLGQFSNDLALMGRNFEVIDYATSENGVHNMIDHFQTLLHRNTEALGLHAVKALSASDLRIIIDLGYVGSTSTQENAVKARIDVSHLVTEAAQHLSDLVLKDIMKLLDSNLNTLTRIVFVGGGANWLKEQAQAWFHTVDIPEQPEMAIVRGVRLLLQNQEA